MKIINKVYVVHETLDNNVKNCVGIFRTYEEALEKVSHLIRPYEIKEMEATRTVFEGRLAERFIARGC